MLTLTSAVTLAQPACPGTATLTVFAENLNDAAPIGIAVDGDLAADAMPCLGPGATSYRETLTCIGSGLVRRCGQVSGLRPGAWVHRLAVTVPGSASQQQAQRLTLLAGDPTDVSNALRWTVYPRTFVVQNTTRDELLAKLAQAEQYTATPDNPGRALVTFSPDAFPGASEPQRIYLNGPCRQDDAGPPGLAFTADRVVVDALDRNAQTGGVILSVDNCGRQVLRLSGSDNVFRGLVFEGSQKSCPKPDCQPSCAQVDTIAVTGPPARRNRIERSVILGPTCGDAVSVDNDAGGPDDEANVVSETRITGAEDKGVKVDLGGFATIERSCVHDNANGGIQSTLGGHVVANENVVQHNLGGEGQNGLTVIDICSNSKRGCTHAPSSRSTLFTQGNVVRFSGGRGLAVRDNAKATFRDDYVADNLAKGSVVETTDSVPFDEQQVERFPAAEFHGIAVVCNRYGGVGAETRVDVGHAVPDVNYGDPQEPGRNAFASNKAGTGSANFLLTNIPVPVAEQERIRAVGNQWAHCGIASQCDLAAIRNEDISPPDAAAELVDLGEPLSGPRVGAPVLSHVSPARPQKGDIVRISGENFNAIEGNPTRGNCPAPDLLACSPAGTCPTGPCVNDACPCSIENEAVQTANKSTRANRIRIKAQDGTILADDTGQHDFWPDAVTPTMLAFRMPFDCFAPLTIEVTKHDPSGNSLSATTELCDRKVCDRKGCQDKPVGSPCDDGDACTANDFCDGSGRCIGGAPLVCSGVCLRCDSQRGCGSKPAGVVCRPAAGLCDVEETCDGVSKDCPSDQFKVCDPGCLAGGPPACRRTECSKALICRVTQCVRRKWRRKLQQLELAIEHALAGGAEPRIRTLRRFAKLLTRCGLPVPATPGGVRTEKLTETSADRG